MNGHAKSAPHEGALVLIVEDSRTQAEQLRFILEQNGFRVAHAANGEAALAKVRELTPEVVVSDIVMPQMDGYQLCRAIKADPVLAEIPVILVTELSAPGDVFKGLDAGADNFLIKPYDEGHLVSRLAYLLANRTLRRSGRLKVGIEIELSGQRHFINAERQQILDLLISTYDQAIILNERLDARQKELAASNAALNALYGLAEALNQCRAEAEVEREALAGTIGLAGTRASWLYRFGGDGLLLAGAKGIDAATVREACVAVPVDAADTEARIVPAPALARSAGATRHALVPLSAGGAPIAILGLLGPGDGGYSAEELRTLTSVGRQVSIALERAALHGALEQKVADRTAELEREIGERGRAEERLRDAIESIGDGFALFGRDDRLVIANRRYREMHAGLAGLIEPGVTFGALAAAGLDTGEAVGPPTAAELAARLNQHSRADGTASVRWQNGRWLMAAERRTSEGGIVAVQSDVSALKAAERAKDEFLAMVSHELRTPLTAIRGVLSIIEAGNHGPLPDSVRRLIDIAKRNSATLMRLIEDLLDVEKISTGNLGVKPEDAEMAPILERVVEAIRPVAALQSLDIRLFNRAPGVVVQADPFRIGQVVNNLLSNAVKFSPKNGTIEVVASEAKGGLRVSVVDHGPGIPESFRGRVFEAFAQADSSASRERGGTGLGLLIAKTIVEAHGGSIGFHSVEGEGATFYFDLPLAAPPAISSVA